MEKEIFAKKLGKRIAKARLEQEVSQVQLAKLMNLPQQNISRLESGVINPSAYSVYEIARLLNVPITELLNF